MSFIHSSGFAYAKNLIIGLGASVVLIGALFKIQSWPFAGEMLTVGLLTEAGLFLMMGLLPPHKEYYWEKLYPGLDEHGGLLEGPGNTSSSGFDGEALTEAISGINLDTSGLEGVQNKMASQQEKMLTELKTMASSMSGLQAFQEADFSEVKNLTQNAGKFASSLNEAITSISESLEDTKVYREQLTELNNNLKGLNQVYGNVLAAMGGSK